MSTRNKLSKLRVALIGVAASSLALSACSDSDETTADSDETTTANGDETPSGQALDCAETLSVDDMLDYSVPHADHEYRITLMQPSLQGYYFQAMAYGANEAAEEAGIDLTVLGGQGYTDPSQQLTDAENVISRGVDAIVLAPVDFDGSVPIVDSAAERDIPVVNISSEVNSDEAYKVLQDDFTQGATSAETLVAALPDGGEGIVMGGPADATWSRRRVEGFRSVIARHPEFSIAEVTNTNGYPDEGLTAFENTIQAHPHPAWIYSVAVYALLPDSIPAAYSDVPYFTASYDPMVAEQLESGGIDATVSNVPVAMGEIGIGTAVAVLNGQQASNGITCLTATPLTAEDVSSPVTALELYPE
jgi:ribose transport system substrate-binding protein